MKVLSCKHKTWNPREELQIRVEIFEKDADVMKGQHESTGIGKLIWQFLKLYSHSHQRFYSTMLFWKWSTYLHHSGPCWKHRIPRSLQIYHLGHSRHHSLYFLKSSMKFFCKLTFEKPEPGTSVGISFVCLFLFCSAILLVWQIACHRNPSLSARILECWNLGTITLIS